MDAKRGARVRRVALVAVLLFLNISGALGQSDPSAAVPMLRRYYNLINQGDLSAAYNMRSRQAKSKVSQANFRSIWANNISVEVSNVTVVASKSGKAQLKVAMTSTDKDLTTGAVSTKLYDGKVKVVYEDGAWRYDDGSFNPVAPEPTYQTPPTRYSSSRTAFTVIAPSVSTSQMARQVLRSIKGVEVEPARADAILVVVRSSLNHPLNSNYDSYHELAEDADGQLNIAGPKFHIYIFGFNGDLSVSELEHKSFPAD